MQPKTILVTGSTGQLGRSLQKIAPDYPECNFTFVGRDTLDLSSSISIAVFFADKKFDFIINAAAYTAVDKAESEPELADQINHLAVKQLAEIAKKKNTTFIHISTDYVFNGKSYKPYTESDKTDPQNVYGLTKLKGEESLRLIQPKGCTIRTSWLYSEFGKNFVKTMLRLGNERGQLRVVSDQVGSPTYATNLAKIVMLLLTQFQCDSKNKKFATYHYSDFGHCSWLEFSKAIFEKESIKCEVFAIKTKDYPTVAQRPMYSVMSNTKVLKKCGFEDKGWKDSLHNCLEIIGFKKGG